MAITRAQQVKQMLQDGGRIEFKKGRDTDYQQRGTDRQTYSASQKQQNFSARDDGPGNNNKVDVGFQEALRKEEKKKKQAQDEEYEGTTQAGGTDFVTDLVEGVNIPDKDDRDRLKTTLREKNPNPLLDFLDPRKRLYNTFPNNPINERKYVEYLESLGVDVPQDIKDSVARGKKLSYDEFQELREFQPDFMLPGEEGLNKPMDFSNYLASQGNFGLLTGGNLGNLKDFKNPGTVINPLTGLPYTDIEFEKLKRESGQGASSYDRGPGQQGTGIPAILPPADDDEDEDDDFQRFARLMADGGSVDDIEREAMFLGGITKGIKKAVKGIKKIAKSPIGKAALIAGGAGFFGMGPFAGLAKTKAGIGLSNLFGGGSFNPLKQLLTGDMLGPGEKAGMGLSKFGLKLSELGLVNPSTMGLTGMGKFAALGIPSALAGIMTDKQKDEFKQPDYPDFNMQAYLQNPYEYTTTRQMADGGIMRAGYQEGSKEPVAKKTMPLLDMDGKEMDFREEGGFVPIGRMEKADDVPARLSKNEFVFTADAVRNAGDGDVDKGAEVMYNMMKNLESGGDVSEESQGLQGAREMFQTSKRLEEVL